MHEKVAKYALQMLNMEKNLMNMEKNYSKFQK